MDNTQHTQYVTINHFCNNLQVHRRHRRIKIRI